VLLLLPVLAACASDKGAVDVTASNTECSPAKSDFDAGKVTFKVHNTGSKVTEMYVYAADDKIVGEVENIGPGTARTLTVSLSKGTYELACKPGQTGKGIRHEITVTGEGGGAKAADRELEVTAVDYSFQLPEGISSIKSGETITFELKNKGAKEHEFEVLDADGEAVGEVGGTEPGEEGKTDMTFTKAGTYTYRCALEDHEQRGMKGTFTVS
jgi:uncharacterized cupredoxin-like copper-binding protein